MLVQAARSKRETYAKPAVAKAKPPSTVHTFPAPIRGWVTNENISAANPGGAWTLDNCWVEESSLRPRGGAALWGTVHATDPCETLMPYRSGTASKMFASTATDIYDVSNPVSPTVIPTASLTGQTNGDYSFTNFATAGGEYIIAVNGVDRMISYDGATWRRVDGATTELPFDAQTVNYGGGGLTVTGGTSGATGVIVEVIDNGATGTLRLKTVVGTFVDNELITASTGSATSNIPTGVTTVPAITGGITDTFSCVWAFKSRLFFIKKDSLKAYAMNAVDSIGGATIDISLAGVMKLGGELMVGATWSTDAGDGMDDLCVFISNQGEVAVYQGSDPSDATAWGLVGVYQMPVPLHKNAIMKAGGNLLVATDVGLIPISSAVKKDIAALSGEAISLPIEPTWKSYVKARAGKWSVIKWGSESRAVVGFPQDAGGIKANFALNLQTGAWSRFTGWDIRCGCELDGDLYFGTPDGKVMKAETSGDDNGTSYQVLYVGLFERLGNITQEKTCHMARSTWQASTNFNYRIGFASNYSYTLGVYPSAASNVSTDVWDTGLWDEAVWDGIGVTRIETEWRSVSGHGFAIAPVVQIAMGGDTVPDVELISIDLLYETGSIVG